MKVSLTPADRLTLINLLPANCGSIAEMIAINEVRDAIEITKEEAEAMNMNAEPNEGGGVRITFDPDKAQAAEREFMLSESNLTAIKSSMDLAGSKHRLPATRDFLALYKKLEPGFPKTA